MTEESQSLSMRVVDAVAAAENVDPSALSTPLAETIDPDALNALFRNGSGRVSFTYHGHEVVAEADGTVAVTALAEA